MRAAPVLAIAVLCCGCDKYDPERHVGGPSSLDSVLTIQADQPSLPADAFSRTRISARIAPNSDSDKRVVKFTTTAGSLVSDRRGTDVQVTADATGLAVVMLESSRLIESAIVRATISNVTREVEVAFTAVNPSSLITIAASESTAPADGKATIRLVATIASGLPAGRRNVEFISTLGEFAESRTNRFQATADNGNRVTATLRSSQAGTARVQAQVDGVSVDTFVQFVSALSD